jgi:hypothetical protein
MKRISLLLFVVLSLGGCNTSVDQSTGIASDAVRCAQNWKRQGFNFDPDRMTSYQMWERAQAIRRAAYWKEKGYVIDPNSLTWQQIDQKVCDIDRAQYWKERGYSFDPGAMTAQEMDKKVRELDQARFWTELGYFYDPASRQVYLSPDKKTRLSSLPSPGVGGYSSGYYGSSWSPPAYSSGSSYSTSGGYSVTSPGIAENGSYYGQISENTGRPKTVHVDGYYRRDGTYVRSHYRSK